MAGSSSDANDEVVFKKLRIRITQARYFLIKVIISPALHNYSEDDTAYTPISFNYFKYITLLNNIKEKRWG
jgi:hypothetical protein